MSSANRCSMSLFVYTIIALAFTIAVSTESLGQSSVKPKKYALLVAVNHYEDDYLNSPELKYPEADARALAEVLRGSSYEVDMLLGPQATRKAIIEKLDNLNTKGNAEGALVLGFFGHGIEYETSGDAMYIPYDSVRRLAKDKLGKQLYSSDGNGVKLTEPSPDSLVAMSEMLDGLRLSKAGSKLLLADCCRKNPNAARVTRAFGSSVKLTDIPHNTAAIFACSEGEEAQENDAWGHGAMTKCFLDLMPELQGNASDVGSITGKLRKSVSALVGTSDRFGKKQTVHPIVNGVVELQLLTKNISSGRTSPSKNLEMKSQGGSKGYEWPIPSGITVYPGSKAPKFPELEFVEGKQFTSFEKGKVYVVTFFASWCSPCVKAIERLSAIQQEYPDITVMDICLEPTQQVREFLTKRGTPFGYTVAVPTGGAAGDDPSMDSPCWKDWGPASGCDGIPTTYVIDKSGKVAWIGHPSSNSSAMDGFWLGKVLAEVHAGVWDVEIFKQSFLEEKAIQECISTITKQLKTEDESEPSSEAIENVFETIDSFQEKASLPGTIKQARNIRVQLMLRYRPDSQEIIPLCREVFSEYEETPANVNALAWGIYELSHSGKLKNRALLEEALKHTLKALGKSESDERWTIQDTIAHLQYELGDVRSALKSARDAVRDAATSTATPDDMKTIKAFVEELESASKVAK